MYEETVVTTIALGTWITKQEKHTIGPLAALKILPNKTRLALRN